MVSAAELQPFVYLRTEAFFETLSPFLTKYMNKENRNVFSSVRKKTKKDFFFLYNGIQVFTLRNPCGIFDGRTLWTEVERRLCGRRWGGRRWRGRRWWGM